MMNMVAMIMIYYDDHDADDDTAKAAGNLMQTFEKK